MLLADGGGQARAIGELQSAAMGRRRTARLKEPQTSLWESSRAVACGDRNGSNAVAGLRGAEAAVRATLRVAILTRVSPSRGRSDFG